MQILPYMIKNIQKISDFSILLVDDEEDILNCIKSFLSSHFENIFTANNPLIAIELIKKEKPDLVILDYKMPDMNGMELMQWLHEYDKSIIKIMLTAFGEKNTIVESLKYQIFDFIDKPFKHDKFLNSVSRAYEHHKSTGITETKFNDLLITQYNLSPSEVKICNMIKKNMLGKEIATLLNISLYTINTHFKNIRKKLNITNKKINLKNHLNILK
jgi:DNA-binding NarL/FixJ family response regulator